MPSTLMQVQKNAMHESKLQSVGLESPSLQDADGTAKNKSEVAEEAKVKPEAIIDCASPPCLLHELAAESREFSY